MGLVDARGHAGPAGQVLSTKYWAALLLLSIHCCLFGKNVRITTADSLISFPNIFFTFRLFP